MSRKYRSKPSLTRTNGSILLAFVLVSSFSTYILLQTIQSRWIQRSTVRINRKILVELQNRLLTNHMITQLPTKTKSQEAIHHIFFAQEFTNPMHFYATTTQNGLEDLGAIDIPKNTHKDFVVQANISPTKQKKIDNPQIELVLLKNIKRLETLQNNPASLEVPLFLPLMEITFKDIRLWNPYDRPLKGTWDLVCRYQEQGTEDIQGTTIPLTVELDPGKIQSYPLSSILAENQTLLNIAIEDGHRKIYTLPTLFKYSWPFPKKHPYPKDGDILYTTETWLQKFEASFSHDPESITFFISNPDYIITPMKDQNPTWALTRRPTPMPDDQFPYYSSLFKRAISQADVQTLTITSFVKTKTYSSFLTTTVKPVYKEGNLTWEIINSRYSFFSNKKHPSSSPTTTN